MIFIITDTARRFFSTKIYGIFKYLNYLSALKVVTLIMQIEGVA